MTYKELIAQDKIGVATTSIFRSVSSLFAWIAQGEFEKEYPPMKILNKGNGETIEENDGKPIENPGLIDFMQFVNSASLSPRSLSFGMTATSFISYLMQHERGDNLDINAEVLDIFNEWVNVENERRKNGKL